MTFLLAAVRIKAGVPGSRVYLELVLAPVAER
jgi:hypothetical protein